MANRLLIACQAFVNMLLFDIFSDILLKSEQYLVLNSLSIIYSISLNIFYHHNGQCCTMRNEQAIMHRLVTD